MGKEMMKKSGGRPALLFVVLLLVWLSGTQVQAASVKFSAKVGRTKLLAGEQCQITFRNTKRITYKFKSSNKKVFTVSRSEGLITARGKGKATLTITGTWTKGKQKVRWKRTVRLQVYACSLSEESIVVRRSEQKQLAVRNLKLRRTVSWYSETPEICQVSAAGVVTGIARGAGAVCVKVGSDVVMRCAVTVTVDTLPGSSITLLVNATHTYGSVDLAGEMNRDANTPGSVTLTPSNGTIGHLDGSIYYADAYGNNTVTASCGPYEKTYTIIQKVWCAHRGYSDMYPENSIDAFVGAALAGAGFIETDIRVTSDGELVCMHDNDLVNMTNAAKGALVSKTPYEQVRMLQINNGNCLEKLTHPQVPAFAEYLQICRTYGIVAVIEIKALGPNSAFREATSKKILAQIEAAGMKDRCIVISPSAALLKAFRDFTGEAGYSIPVAATTADVWNTARTYNLPNSYPYYWQTPFGTATGSDYSPLVGRKNRAVDSYHNRA